MKRAEAPLVNQTLGRRLDCRRTATTGVMVEMEAVASEKNAARRRIRACRVIATGWEVATGMVEMHASKYACEVT